MSASPPSPLPAHLRPIPVEIPATWTPEPALAVFELLDEIRDKNLVSLRESIARSNPGATDILRVNWTPFVGPRGIGFKV